MTNIPKKISGIKGDMERWRHQLHEMPELAFEENKTYRFLMRQLKQFAVDDIHVMAGTGIVVTLHGKHGAATPDNGKKAIMLRAEMDALPIQEKAKHPHASRHPGVHHACGHDGHMAMLLGAAKHLSEGRDFDGTVYIVFQPAEEHKGGAKELISEGLFQFFPADEVYGLHNHPALPLGMFATTKGPMLAASDEFHISLKGKGGHASDAGKLTNLAAALGEIAVGIEKIGETVFNKADPAVMAICEIETDSKAANIIASEMKISGTLRTFDSGTHDAAKAALETLVKGVARKYNADADLEFKYGYPLLVNSDVQTDFAVGIAEETAGQGRVMTQVPKTLGVEDFADYLKHKPGNFMAIGTGRLDSKGKPDPEAAMDLHTAKYDFNDAALPLGAAYWVKLVEKALPLNGAHPIAKAAQPQGAKAAQPQDAKPPQGPKT